MECILVFECLVLRSALNFIIYLNIFFSDLEEEEEKDSDDEEEEEAVEEAPKPVKVT